MVAKLNLEGKRFGRLTVIGDSGKRSKGGKVLHECLCDCGKHVRVEGSNLTCGITQSCGCLQRERARTANTTHGYASRGEKTRTYKAWRSMKGRCLNPKIKDYHNYGGRGIVICKRWMKFENFLEDMGEVPKGLTLERMNNEGNYEPSNCKWATRKEQTRNTRQNRFIKFDGKSHILTDWAKIIGIERSTLAARIKKGWSIEESLTIKLKGNRGHHD